MLQIDDNLRRLYKNDSIPYVSELCYKELFLYFPNLNLTITNSQIVSDSFILEESLCSETELTFGACEATLLKVTVADVVQDLKGQEMVVTQMVNGTYQMPLGTYKVESAKKQSDLRFKDIVAYDQMTKFDTDVSAWYNGLSFPTTIRKFRLGLCAYIGVEIVDQTLPNDTMLITKTISPTVLSGRDVLRRIAEINGSFGHITRDNNLKFIGLSNLGLYPSEKLYPSEDLFPAESSEILGAAGYKNSQYEEYEVQPIDKLQIREQEGDIGVTAGSGSNGYIIEGNFLVYGKSTSELTTIANNLFLMIKNKKYRPHTTNIVGLPYIEVGDAISIVTTTDVIETFVFRRVLTGIQALNDEISASGSENREQNFGISSQIEQLKGQTVKITSDLNGLDIQVNGPGGLTSQITATASEVSSKVSKGSVVSEINQSAEEIKIKANKISLEGFKSFGEKFGIKDDGTAYANEIYIQELLPIGSLIDCLALRITSSAFLIEDKYLWEIYSRINHDHDSQYSSSSHGHATGGSIGASFTSSSLGTSDLITFTNTSGAQNAATAGYVNAKVASASDKRLKQNGTPIKDVTDQYMLLVPMEYEFKPMVGNQYKHFGLYAQDVIEIYPEDKYDLVGVDNISITEEQRELCPTGIYEINYNNLHALHIKMIQKHENEIQVLKDENKTLKNELTELKTLLKERGVI